MLESELGLIFLRTDRLPEAKAIVEKGKDAVEELQVGFTSSRRCLRDKGWGKGRGGDQLSRAFGLHLIRRYFNGTA